MSKSTHGPRWAQTLIQSLPQGIITLDASGLVTFLNPAAEAILRWPLAAALGRPIDQVMPSADGNAGLLEVLTRGSLIPPLHILNRQGSELTLAVTAARNQEELVLTIRDVTDERAAQRLRSYFLANISHEFRTPLSALKASVELLLEGVEDFTRAELLELARSVHYSVTSLQTLVDNLLESESIDAGRFRIRRRSTSLPALIDEARTIMRPLLERRNQAVCVDLPLALPSLSVDPVRITQVLVNLLSNASKYGPVDQPIELAVTQQDCALRVSVADRGSGISAADQQSIFHRFVRLDDKDNTQYGVGLGLSVVKTIVEGHGGTVGLDPRAGGGSVFWFMLPLEEA